MIPTFKNIHSKFKLNGTHFNREELKEVAYSFVKEGVSYEREIGDFLIDWLNDKSFVDVQTSGSTGTPKTIRLEKQAMVLSALATGDYFGLKPGDTALHCLPSNFIAGKMMLVRAMILGWSLRLLQPSSTPLENHSETYDFCAMIPLQVSQSLEKLQQIKILIIGGAAVSPTLQASLQNVRTRAFAMYGMTETITHIAAKPLNQLQKADSAYFTTLPDITVTSDARDCLVIDALRITNEKITTNDVVRIYSATTFEWLGRFDNVINSGGVKLHPEQIEAKLNKVLQKPFFVAGFPDEKLGEKLILLIEENNSKQTSEAVLEKITELKTLDIYEIPKAVYFLPKFVKTSTGKLQRKETLKQIRK